ncbi:MAG TPA: sigma 54-interacting transcriptional regulator [Thermoanaerobacterales bacterium]|nr:sigma 54-interacting transcriptional regulator [Thermoanaerobacterales bacterium]
MDALYQYLFNNTVEGVLIVDKDCKIQYFNDSYSQLIHASLKDVQHQDIRKFRQGAMIPSVLERKVAMVGVLREEQNKKYFVNIYPIIKNDEVVGGFSIVTLLSDARSISEQIRDLVEKNQYTQEKIETFNHLKYSFNDVIAESTLSKKVKNLAKKVAKTDATVLLQGESGTGKEIYAQSIHYASHRSNRPFIPVNCSTFSSSLLESELFGYEANTFTGAKKGGKAGLFEAANGGTIFLDEVSEMDIGMQAKLLRVLQENKIRRVGGVNEIDVDVRIISACNVDLDNYIEKGKFRKDLYYRLSVFPITIPPLRKRRQDIKPLIDSQLARLSVQKMANISISDEALNKCISYDWPGNVRELINALEFASIMASNKGIITCDELPKQIITISGNQNTIYDSTESSLHDKTLSERIKMFEKNEILKQIEYYGNDVEGKKKAAEALGISLASLYNKLKA